MYRNRVSLRDIGRQTGLSHVTVSLALRNHPSVAVASRQRIQAAAAQLGYKPDPMLRALAEYRKQKRAVRYQGALAWINNFPNPEELDNHYGYAQYRRGAEQRALELGYQIIALTPTAQHMTATKLRRVLLTRGIRGMLLPPQPVHHTVLDFDFDGFSAVAFGFTLASPELHVVANSMFRSSAMAMRVLRASGHRKIGMILSKHLNDRTESMFAGGFLGEQTGLPLADRVPCLIWNGPLTETHRKGFFRWMRTHRPCAIMTDQIPWIRESLRQIRLSVPRDVSLAALHIGPASQNFAGIDQNNLEIGARAVDTLVGMIYRNETGVPKIPCRTLIESVWQNGGTVRAR